MKTKPRPWQELNKREQKEILRDIKVCEGAGHPFDDYTELIWQKTDGKWNAWRK